MLKLPGFDEHQILGFENIRIIQNRPLFYIRKSKTDFFPQIVYINLMNFLCFHLGHHRIFGGTINGICQNFVNILNFMRSGIVRNHDDCIFLALIRQDFNTPVDFNLNGFGINIHFAFFIQNNRICLGIESAMIIVEIGFSGFFNFK